MSYFTHAEELLFFTFFFFFFCSLYPSMTFWMNAVMLASTRPDLQRKCWLKSLINSCPTWRAKAFLQNHPLSRKIYIPIFERVRAIQKPDYVTIWIYKWVTYICDTKSQTMDHSAVWCDLKQAKMTDRHAESQTLLLFQPSNDTDFENI